MLRLLILVALVLLVWMILDAAVRRVAGAAGRGGTPGARTGPGRPPVPPAADRLIACATCGVRVPERRALAAGDGSGGAYCSEACRRAAAAAS